LAAVEDEKEVSLDELLDAVRDEASFLCFLKALENDWEDEHRKETANPSPPYSSGANGWENSTIGAFLESARAWGESTKDRENFYKLPFDPWNRAAQIIYAGKFYE
jgi:hypothetical protein